MDLENRVAALEAKIKEFEKMFAGSQSVKKTDRPDMVGLADFDIPVVEKQQDFNINSQIPSNPIADLMKFPDIHADISAGDEMLVLEEEIDVPVIEYARPAAVEGMPHLVRKLEVVWGHKESHDFFNQLIIQEHPTDNRPGRQGFSPEVMSELLFLQRLTTLMVPQEEKKGWEITRRG